MIKDVAGTVRVRDPDTGDITKVVIVVDEAAVSALVTYGAFYIPASDGFEVAVFFGPPEKMIHKLAERLQQEGANVRLTHSFDGPPTAPALKAPGDDDGGVVN